MYNNWSFWFSLGCCTVGNFLITGTTVAQVTPDNTTSTTVNSNGNNNFTIEDGDRAGGNLFHSFDSFSVPNGGSAFFDNASEIENIFSRVTGGNISNIDGLIQANDANLFLINPAGIIFGENGSLDIGGSFLGTTADSILFEDGEFSATDLDNPPLLTINAPIGLSFRDNPGDIINRAGFIELNEDELIENAGLTVNQGEFLTLAGGNINLEDGRLTAPGGRIELGGIITAGTVQLNEDFSLNFPEGLTRANVSLTGFAEIDVTSGGSGSINIFAQNIDILGGSDICAGIGSDGACGGRNENLGSSSAQAGDIFLNAIDTITVDGGISDVNNNVNEGSVGNSGNIIIETGSLFITNGGRVNTITAGEGNAGAINISATEQVFLADSIENPFSSIRNNIDFTGVGDAAGININTDTLSVNDGAQIQSLIFGEGNSGKITIDANTVEFSGRDVEDFASGAFSLVQSGGVGDAGGISITANTLLMSDRAQFLSNTAGTGNGGNINLQIANETTLLNSSILTEVSAATEELPGGIGDGGDINITTSSLLLKNGSSLLADAENVGNAGNINIEAVNDVILEGKGISAGVGATNIVPSQISTTVEEQATGDGGNIDVVTSSLTVKNDGFINATALGEGDAGIINITSGEIALADGGEILARTTFGEGGNIFLNVEDNLTLENNSLISAEAFNNADGGNITIDTEFVIAFPNQIEGNGNDIIASAQSGNGGVISISAESILGIKERKAIDNNQRNDLDASSDFGLDGQVSIFTPDVNTLQGIGELPSNVVSAEQTVAQTCAANITAGSTNSLVVKGKGGIPTNPGNPLTSETISINGQSSDRPDNLSSSSYVVATSKGNIIPARGVLVTEDGEIILTAVPTSNTVNRVNYNSPNCLS